MTEQTIEPGTNLIVLHRGPFDGRAAKLPIQGVWPKDMSPAEGVRYLRSDIFTSYGARIYYFDASPEAALIPEQE